MGVVDRGRDLVSYATAFAQQSPKDPVSATTPCRVLAEGPKARRSPAAPHSATPSSTARTRASQASSERRPPITTPSASTHSNSSK